MFETVLFSSEQNWALWAILVTVAAFGLWAEKTKWGARLSAAIIAILGTFVLSNLSIIPTSAPVYDVVWSYLVPLAIPLLLFQADLRKILRETGPTLIAFMMGATGTVLGTIIAFSVIPLGEEGWKLAGIFCSTYIGGSINFVATAEAVDMKSGDVLTASMAADNLMMTVYFIILFALPAMKWLLKFLPIHDKEGTASPAINRTEVQPANNIDLLNIATALALSFMICAIGFGLANLINIPGSGILIITALVIIIATLFPHQIGKIRGADQLGILLMQIFFATIGASANIIAVLTVGPILFVFAGLILLVHLLFLLISGKFLKLGLAELVIASNANMGGPTTAAAMAVAKKWDHLVIPAILCGTLGYAMATFMGVGLAHLLREKSPFILGF
jgi:uncharacterized membrane protein